MAETTFEKVLAEALALPVEQQQRLAETLIARKSDTRPLKTLEQLIAEQGTRPLTFEEMLGPAGMWPEDESADDFLNEWRQWRSETSDRSLEA